MATLPHFKYVVSDRDRHGNRRWYYREPGRAKVRLKSPHGSDAFMAEYVDARAATGVVAPATLKPKSGTVAALVMHYRNSRSFKELCPSTSRVRERILNRIISTIGGNKASDVRRTHVKTWRDAPEGYAAGNTILLTLRQVFKLALDDELVTNDPTLDVKNRPSTSQGHQPWTLEHCRQYIRQHPRGTSAHTALCLFLFTGQRVSDVRLLGPRNRQANTLKFTQVKNSSRKPVKLALPIIRPLADVLDPIPPNQDAYVISEKGKPFKSDKSFSQRYSKWCREAGLENLTAHGVRKGLGTILAEAGVTHHQIGAVLGHSTLKEVERYTKGAQQKVLAVSGMAALEEKMNQEQIVPPSTDGI